MSIFHSSNCDFFYDNGNAGSCSSLSLASILLVAASVFILTFSIITFLYYRYSKRQKSVVLEELRQGLLYNNDTSTNPAYIQAMQEALILKDVMVAYEEIKIESQIGEGSFGVVSQPWTANIPALHVAIVYCTYMQLTTTYVHVFI